MAMRKSIIVLLAATALTASPALAQEVGVATAVNPTSQGAAPGGGLTVLTVGARIIHKERIHTTPSGTMQLRFLDKSTLSIGPNADITIDEFVFDPNSGSGHMAIKLATGTFRLVGGLLSHQGEATVTTPEAVIGIRGGTGVFTRNGQGTQVFDYNGKFTVTNGVQTGGIWRPGYFLTIQGWLAKFGDPQLIPPQLAALHVKILTSGPGQNGGVPDLTNAKIGNLGDYDTGPDTWSYTGFGENNGQDTITQGTHQGTGRTPPPRHVY
jgi:FecR protein